MLVLAHQIQGFLDQGRVENFQKLAKWLNMSFSRLSQISSLLLLSPAIKQDILLSDDERVHYLSEYKFQDIIVELDWKKQEETWREIKGRLT